MKRFAPLLLALGGCNQLFHLDPTELRDSGEQGPDALVSAPDGSMTCGAPPNFAAWTFTPHTVAGVDGVIHPTFLSADKIAFMDHQYLYVSGLDDGPIELTDFGGFNAEPAAAPTHDLFWYVRSGGAGSAGLFYATHDAAGVWSSHPTAFGVDAFQLEPGQAGYYAGSVRMVIAIQGASSALHLVELSSTDGTEWQQLATIPWAAAFGGDYDPSLSIDGCTVLFTRDGGAGRDLYFATRQADGNFGAPQPLPGGSSPSVEETQAVLDPTNTRLWFTSDLGLFEGRP